MAAVAVAAVGVSGVGSATEREGGDDRGSSWGGWHHQGDRPRSGGTWFDGATFDVLVPNRVIDALGTPTLSGNTLSFDAQRVATAGDPFRYIATLLFRADDGYTLDSADLSVEGSFRGRRANVQFDATSFAGALGRGNSAEVDTAWLQSRFVRADHTWTATGSLDFDNATLAGITFSGQGRSGRGERALLEQDLLRFDLHVTQVPEAGEWLMLIAGVGLISIVVRRRRAA